jgi:hypothetical protein
MGLAGLGMGSVQNNNPPGGGGGCYLLRWRRVNNPLALPPKYPIPTDLSITEPTCLIAERDGAPLGEKHEALARR